MVYSTSQSTRMCDQLITPQVQSKLHHQVDNPTFAIQTDNLDNTFVVYHLRGLPKTLRLNKSVDCAQVRGTPFTYLYRPTSVFYFSL